MRLRGGYVWYILKALEINILSVRAWYAKEISMACKKPAAVLFLQLLDGDLLPLATERCIGA